MNIAIVGAGIVGVTTAYELARDGHSVSVFEARSSAAEEASFATGALLAPGPLVPWAAPGATQGPSVWGARATLRLGRALSCTDLDWLRRWRRAARAYAHSATPQPPLQALERLARYSHARLHALSDALELQFERSTGMLLLLRTPADATALQPVVQALRDAGTVAHEIDADAARRIEPGLSSETPLAGALHLPGGEAGNCRQFALLLRQAAQQLGAQFHFNTRITALAHTPAGVQVQGEATARRFDAVVLCAGVASAALLRPLGLRLPLVALHGCSISAPLREALHAPHSAVVDARHQASIVRLGQRVRVSGGAELGRRGTDPHGATLRMLYRVLSDWFPGGAQLSGSLQIWRGARPTLPDGPPVVGASGRPGLWLNLGHGASGWALACGSARALADAVAGRAPDVSLDGLDAQRF
ncbi:amino acid dehydrogenase [Acidovorax sp. SRB_14]|uniref:FAD-dependent oxidoreductase n=1 Tax=Acidovorax sp. SRB_14 TaxID=1962699 RepID=UPI001564DF8C|nr:FAD-dependent oxidoreductase [Acidovorax sp. SRB_14]NMM79875.1 amino acid dehydrogenase [Acidovorax sp. SRB_14]